MQSSCFSPHRGPLGGGGGAYASAAGGGGPICTTPTLTSAFVKYYEEIAEARASRQHRASTSNDVRLSGGGLGSGAYATRRSSDGSGYGIYGGPPHVLSVGGSATSTSPRTSPSEFERGSLSSSVSPPPPSPAPVECTMEYLADLVKEKKQLEVFPHAFTHVEKLIDDEINRVRLALFQCDFATDDLHLPDPEGEVVCITEKLYVPRKEHPEYNFVGRILGPRGMTAKQLEQETGCKIMVRGKGSMRDKRKEEVNRGKPNWEHLEDELHVLIQCEDTANRASIKMKAAVEHVKRLLIPAPEGTDELKRKQLMELAIINGTYRPFHGKQANDNARLLSSISNFVSPIRTPAMYPLSPSGVSADFSPFNLPSSPLPYDYSALMNSSLFDSLISSYYGSPSPPPLPSLPPSSSSAPSLPPHPPLPTSSSSPSPSLSSLLASSASPPSGYPHALLPSAPAPASPVSSDEGIHHTSRTNTTEGHGSSRMGGEEAAFLQSLPSHIFDWPLGSPP